MRFLLSVAAASVLFGASATAQAWEEPAAPQTRKTPSAAAAVDQKSGPATGEKWRFRQHQGLWWYWLPSEKWVYWSDGKWVNYDPQTYSQLHASRKNRVYSYRRSTDGYPELGQWGPVRYNSYGQREYPYSRRNSGIRQLGPVPAMGGVRSLPGWGGER